MMNVIFSKQRLLAVAGLCLASAVNSQTPPAQPAYPSSPQKRVVNPQRERTAEEDANRRRCERLTGVEKSECERRDTSNDDAPAGVTPSMREKEEKARAEKESASKISTADPRSDTADARTNRSASSAVTSSAKPDEKEKADAAKEPASESDTESDSLDRPREQ